MARKTPTAWLLVTYLIEKLTSVTEEPNERGKSGVQWLDWGLKRAKLLKNIEVNLGIKAGATSNPARLKPFCHPERSCRFAQRSGNGVEEPLAA
jgi:hypothetical protein